MGWRRPKLRPGFPRMTGPQHRMRIRSLLVCSQHHLRVSYWTNQRPILQSKLTLPLRQESISATAIKAVYHGDEALVMTPVSSRSATGSHEHDCALQTLTRRPQAGHSAVQCERPAAVGGGTANGDRTSPPVRSVSGHRKNSPVMFLHWPSAT
jgi:hypothetical protein